MTSPTARPGSDLPVRIAVGAALIVVALGALVLGGVAFWLISVVAGLFMMAEWAELHRVGEPAKRLALFSLSVPLAILSPWAAGPDFFALGLIAGAAFFIVIVTRRTSLAMGIVYVALPIAALLAIRALPNGLILAFWTLATVWATDIGAYFAGRAIGGPRLAPAISPSKTWAGLFGGMAAALLSGLAFLAYAGLDVRLALITPLLAVVAQIGDLYESAVKRRAGVKDSGNILPGHGGVLDRLDGAVTVAPVAFMAIVVAARLA